MDTVGVDHPARRQHRKIGKKLMDEFIYQLVQTEINKIDTKVSWNDS